MRHARSLRTKLTVAFAAAIALVVGAGLGVALLARSVESARSQGLAWSTAVILVADLDTAWEGQEAALRGVELDGGAELLSTFNESDAEAAQLEATLTDLLASESGLHRDVGPLLEASIASRAAWTADVAQAPIDTVLAGQDISQHDLVDGEVAFTAAQRPLDELRTAAEAGRQEARELFNERNDVFLAASVGSAALAAAVIVGLLLLVQRWITRPMSQVAAAVEHLADGELDHPVPTPGPAEIAQLGAGVETMRLRLRAELSRVVDASYLAAAEDERARLAGEIHDDTLQTMAAVSIRLELASQSVTDAEVVTQLDRCREGIYEASRRLRNLLFELHPPSLDSGGLAAALEDYADFLFRGTTTEVEVSSDLDTEPVPAVQALGYRVGRELVLNVAKHAQANHLAIRVSARDGGIDLVVEDDGVGLPFDGAPPRVNGRGLRGVSDLVARAGGQTDRTPGPEGGSRVAVWLPA